MTLLTLVHKIDIALLVATRCGVEFCVEWFSWSQRVMERVLIGGYALLATANGVVRHCAAWWHIITALVALSLIFDHIRCDRDRVVRLWSGSDAVVRVFAIVMMSIALAFRLLLPFNVTSLLSASEDLLLTAALLVTALPTSGTSGRRRRAAKEKLSALFSPSFEPACGGVA